MSTKQTVPLYRFLAIKDMQDKGMSLEDIGKSVKMSTKAVEKALKIGAVINKPAMKHRVGIVHEWKGQYVYPMPGGVWLGAENRKMVVVPVKLKEATKVDPQMPTADLLKTWGVSHNDLRDAERKFLDRLRKALPARTGSMDNKKRIRKMLGRHLRKNTDESLDVAKAFQLIVEGMDSQQVVERLLGGPLYEAYVHPLDEGDEELRQIARELSNDKHNKAVAVKYLHTLARYNDLVGWYMDIVQQLRGNLSHYAYHKLAKSHDYQYRGTFNGISGFINIHFREPHELIKGYLSFTSKPNTYVFAELSGIGRNAVNANVINVVRGYNPGSRTIRGTHGDTLAGWPDHIKRNDWAKDPKKMLTAMTDWLKAV